MQRACHFYTDSHFWKGSDNLSANEPYVALIFASHKNIVLWKKD